MKQVVNLLYNEWDMGKKASQAKGKVCAWIYFFEIMEESEKIVLEKIDNKVIGICGYSKWNSKKNLLKKYFYRLLKNILIHSPLIKNKQAIYEYNENYDYLPKELENYFDGEVSILIVDKIYRGNNYGKKLLLKVFEMAKSDNMKNLQILTDESCNFKFYEKLGCIKVYEKTITYNNNTSCEKGYIYEKKIN